MESDFNQELETKYSQDERSSINALILKVLEEGSDKDIGSDKWVTSLDKEKHDRLNETYHINLYTEDTDEEINVSYYTGIDVGCEMVDFSFDGTSIKNEPRFVRVLIDLKVDELRTPKGSITISCHVLKLRKDEIMDIYQKQGYDNYVTGGGTSKTDKYYKDAFKKYDDMGLFWVCVYEEQQVDRF